tara:strand:- start:2202 stop:2591 length:390 start_codon:yes stop_codon:yes gene_type:complete
MKHNNDYKYDLDFGIISEKFYGKVMHDLIEGKTECKAERDQWVKTGNMFVEFESRGKPSGIATTHAEHWVVSFYKENKLCFTLTVPIEDMKKIARKGKLIKGGDENTSKGMLVKVKDVMDFFMNGEETE